MIAKKSQMGCIAFLICLFSQSQRTILQAYLVMSVYTGVSAKHNSPSELLYNSYFAPDIFLPRLPVFPCKHLHMIYLVRGLS